MLRRLFDYIIRDSFSRFHPGESLDSKIVTIVIASSMSLIGVNYLKNIGSFNELMLQLNLGWLAIKWYSLESIFPNARLFRLTHWVLIVIVFQILIPFLIIWGVFKESLMDYGLKIRGAFSESRIYLLLLLLVVPVVALVSFLDSFQNAYPFYRPLNGESWSYFLYWETIYILQFFAVEFFFRGFLLHGLKRHFGFYSIFVAVIPYCMIHFGKPLPEAIASIVAGIVLGALSLRTNSIWQGVVVHCVVAIEMDLLGLYHAGYF